MILAREEAHISSLIVYCSAVTMERVKATLETFPELEVVLADAATGKLVVLTETQTMNDIKDVISQIQRIGGVLAVNMIYHHAESPASLQEVIA